MLRIGRSMRGVRSLPRSIRWRLPLSYAAIALLTALCLGAVLLTTLTNYYAQRELEYLSANAETIAIALAQPSRLQLAPRLLQLQIESFSFLSQTRVRLLDAQGRAWLDSGIPTKVNVTFGMLADREEAAHGQDSGADYTPFIFIGGDRIEPAAVAIRALGSPSLGATTPWSRVVMARDLAVVGTPYGFGMNPEATSGDRRSTLVVRKAVYTLGQDLLGYLELSDGPAYGSDIIDSVARGLSIAAGIAVLIAGAVGWVISGRIGAPVMELAGATARMAAGDLSARVSLASEDEFGMLAASFNHMASRVEDMVGALRQFVADAAHEFHTPLTALRTNLELAATARTSGERAQVLSGAQEQVERLEMLTSGLLDLSRLEAGGETAEVKPLDLAAVVRDVSEAYASEAEQRGLGFVLDVAAGSLVTRGDVGQMKRAVANLLDNAIKFTPEGGTVTVRLDVDDLWARLAIEDTGIGVPQDDVPQLFGRFHRGRNAASYPGSGLGLAIVKAIVERHGGRIVVENLSPGTRFVTWLPIGTPPTANDR